MPSHTPIDLLAPSCSRFFNFLLLSLPVGDYTGVAGVTWGSHPSETLKPAFDEVVATIDELKALLLAKANQAPAPTGV